MTMRVTVLGCGSSDGVPRLGPDWGACDPNEPRNRRRRVSIVVERGHNRLLVDSSPDLREQLLDAGVSRLDAVLYTHDHADHTHGIDDLRSVNYRLGRPLAAYGEAAVLDSIAKRFGYAFGPMPAGAPWFRPSLIAHPVSGRFSIGAIEVMPFRQIHGKAETTGFRFGGFAYSTDVNIIPEESFAVLAGIEVWLVDCLRYHPSFGHAHLERSLEWIARVKPRQAVLTHMGPDLDYRELCRRLPAGVEPAYDGMVIELPAS